MQGKHETLRRVQECGVVAVIRAPSKEALLPIAEALIAGGVIAIEVTLSTPGAIAGIATLVERLGDRGVVGVGTVLEAASAYDAISAGAAFVVSPVFRADVVETTLRHGRVSIPGAYTPTEIVTAFQAGGDVIKVFPATTLGPGYFRDLLAPMPQLRLTPTGGVDVATTPQWIQAGALFVGAGSALVSRESMAKQDWASITSAAAQFAQAVRQGRSR